MNRKNVTAAVLAGLAGIAGIAGTAQAVNLNPDGVGQVLIYPYYTSNAGNQTLLSVVNTTNQAKAVKVRFLEGHNSREVLDFNLYLSKFDVWVAAIAQPEVSTGDGKTFLYINDTSCTVPYLYGMGGVQEFLPFAYTGLNTDGGPTDNARTSEGHIEMVEMGVLTNDSYRPPKTLSLTDPGRLGSAEAATHVLLDDGTSEPADCEQLVRNWTDYSLATNFRDDPLDGMWFDEAVLNGNCDPLDPKLQDDADCKSHTDTTRNSGGLFGSGTIVNVGNGTMYSYNPKAVQGFDKSSYGMHYIPGTIHPSLNDGNQNSATIFFGTPKNEAVTLHYDLSVDAVSAVFMHNNIMNEFVIEDDIKAASEWIFTFPTKSFYVDPDIVGATTSWHPDPADLGCNNWSAGDPFPGRDGPDPDDDTTGTYFGPDDPGAQANWLTCTYIKTVFTSDRPPFTTSFDGEACEIAFYKNWDREESPSIDLFPEDGPIVSPAPPGTAPPGLIPFELCYEVNILRFSDEAIFGTVSDLLLTVDQTPDAGWANVELSWVIDLKDTLGKIEHHQDRNGLVGLPVIGFAAEEFENDFLDDGVKAHYGGLFDHKASVRRIRPNCDLHDLEDDCTNL
jgi:hypothetical protein